MAMAGLEIGAGLFLERIGVDQAPLLTRLQRAAYAPWLPVLGLEPLPYRTDYALLLRDHDAWLARTADGTEAAALVLRVEPDHLLIWSVAVVAAQAGQGRGRALMSFAEAEAIRWERHEIRLYTNALMTRNIALYQHLGYGETGRETTRDGRRVVHMAKVIAWPCA
jgi:ribosomal protein S18 acetylase RimI-like enzyme